MGGRGGICYAMEVDHWMGWGRCGIQESTLVISVISGVTVEVHEMV